MDSKKQRLMIEYLINSPTTYALCAGIVKADYFDAEVRNSVSFINKYYEQYRTTPDVEQIKAETGLVFKEREVNRDQIEYCSTEIETFCKQKAMESAVLKSVELIEERNYGKVEELIKDAVMISLKRDLGTDYFGTVEERLQKLLDEPMVNPTGWTEVDDALFGGISRQELLLLAANSGGGKSITLSNLAVNFSIMNLHVLYITLELSEPIVSQRIDTMFTGIGRRDWKNHIGEIVANVSSKKGTHGSLFVKQMPAGTTANEIRAYLKEYELVHGRVPDLLVVDYLDEMGSNEGISAENIFEKDKACASQLRQIGVDHNMFTATASQLNRGAVNAPTHDHSHIAGGISKINICDVFIILLQTETQKVEGAYTFKFMKTRNSDGNGKIVYLKWEPKTLRILDRDEITKDKSMDFVPKKKETGLLDETPTGNGLLDMLSH